MKKREYQFAGVLFIVSLVSSSTFFAQGWKLEISGDVRHPMVLTPGSFGELPRTIVEVKNRNGVNEEFGGVLLYDLLSRAGAPMGDSVEGKNQTWYLQAEALDGYKVIFALPEIDTSFGLNSILLADVKDGAPLGKKASPLEIVVPNQHRHARWIRQVAKLRVLKAQE